MFERIEAEFIKLENKPLFEFGMLAIITLLATVLRFYKLGEWSFWFDEVFYLNRTLDHYGDLDAVIQTSIAHKFLPVSIILSSGALNIFGISEWSARLIPVIIGIISIPILYFPTKKTFGWRVSLLACFLLAISIWHIFWSQNARFYTSLLLFSMLALFAFYFAFEHDRPLYILLGYFFLYLAFSERLVAIWVVPVIAIYLIVLKLAPLEKPGGFRLRNIALVILLPVVGIAVIDGFSVLTTGSARLLTGSFFADFDFFLLYRGKDPLRLLYLIAFNISFPAMCLAFFSGIYLIMKKNRAGLFFFCAALVPVILILLLNPFIFTKDRYVFLTLFSWLVLTAVGIRELMVNTKGNAKILVVGILALFIADAAGSTLFYYAVNNGNRRDWEGTLSMIEERAEGEDIVVSFWPELMGYYLGEEGLEWQSITPEYVSENGNRFWFVLDSETIWANGRMLDWLKENGELIEVKYLRTPEDLSLRIYLYDPDTQKND